jgi:hypothetical protein
MPGKDKIGSVTEERQKLQKLEAPLREAAEKDPGSIATAQARKALQTEVDKINRSPALQDPNSAVRSSYVDKLFGYLKEDDTAKVGTADNRSHLTTIKVDKPGHMVILPDTTIGADEDRCRANEKLGLKADLDAGQATHFLRTHGRSEAVVQSYDKAVFGLSSNLASQDVRKYESEFSNLRKAAYNLFAARIGLEGHNLATATSDLTSLLQKLNAEGADHVNHLLRGMNNPYTDCFENKNGTIALKSDPELTTWQNGIRSRGVAPYDLGDPTK